MDEVRRQRRRVEPLPTQVTAFVGRTRTGTAGKPELCRSFHEFEQLFGGLSPDSDLGHSVQLFFLNGGSHAVISRAPGGDISKALAALVAPNRQYSIAVLCVGSPGPNAEVDLDTWLLAKQWCEENMAMLLVDPPSSWRTIDDVIAIEDGFRGMRGPNVAFYYPSIEAPDQLAGGKRRVLPPSGAVAGLISRIDNERGIWKAPAGIDARLRAITGIERSLTDVESARLVPSPVNPIRLLDDNVAVVWGARTSVGFHRSGSDWKYIPVRRLALFIEQTLDRGLKWASLEANDETLWTEVRAAIDEFMFDLYRKGAFGGLTPEDSWFVRCGERTTTQNDIDEGFINIVVGFAPLKPAEFITLRHQLSAKVPAATATTE